jgi:hypothetical protein
MCAENFSFSGWALREIWSHLYPRFGKWSLLRLFVWVSWKIKGSIFFETACAIIHKTLPFTIYIKLSKIWGPRLSKLGRGLHGLAHKMNIKWTYTSVIFSHLCESYWKFVNISQIKISKMILFWTWDKSQVSYYRWFNLI